ncbi:hypothetical protein TorRG33x02_347840 [Trema orientale]|uniref:Uncharacterized protein n=1 Tax=Trema orientale TaxID=63057 RepID=A0A2P5AL50_TREOI|nr:hypothetical protein TorRG33x02_347840 [Trema orientale]
MPGLRWNVPKFRQAYLERDVQLILKFLYLFATPEIESPIVDLRYGVFVPDHYLRWWLTGIWIEMDSYLTIDHWAILVLLKGLTGLGYQFLWCVRTCFRGFLEYIGLILHIFTRWSTLLSKASVCFSRDQYSQLLICYSGMSACSEGLHWHKLLWCLVLLSKATFYFRERIKDELEGV